MPLEQILSEIQRAAADAAAVQQRAVEEGARLRAAATAEAEKRRDELIEEARRIAEHELHRLLAQVRKRSLRRSAEERARGLQGAAGEARRQLATVRETSASAERLKELAREAAEILSAAASAQPGLEGEQSRAEGFASAALRGALIVVDLRELVLVGSTVKPGGGERYRA